MALFLLVMVGGVQAALVRLLHAAPSVGESKLSLLVNGTSVLGSSSFGVFSPFVTVGDGYVNLTVTTDNQSVTLLSVFEASLHYSVALHNMLQDSAPSVSVLRQNFTLPMSYGPDQVKIDLWSLYPLQSEASGLQVYQKNTLCFNCSYSMMFILNTSNSHFEYKWSADSDSRYLVAQEGIQGAAAFEMSLYPRSVYTLVLLPRMIANGPLTVLVETEVTGPWMFTPIVVAALIFLTLALLALVVDKCVQQRKERHKGGRLYEEHSLPFVHLEPVEVVPTKPARLRSLDTFRGISLCVMMFANKGGGGYWFFDHSWWNGLTFADLVFPWFIFMMGCSMALSFKGVAKEEPSYGSLFWKVAKRSAILFCLGLFVNGGDDFRNWRVPGVLQRFGVSFFVVSLIVIFVPGRLLDPSTSEVRHGVFADILPFLLQWVVILLIIAAWLCVTFLLPVPGCPTGYLGPGGLADQGLYPGCQGGAAGYIDMQVFGLHHMYGGPTCVGMYHCGAFDPEGLLGCLTSVVITYLGYQTGRIVTTYKEHSQRLSRWLIWGLVLCLIAGILCGFKQNGGLIPVNKNLWSLSFVLVMAGFGMIALSICYVIVDVWKVWSGKPFYFVGMNSIAVYLLSEVIDDFPFSYVVYDEQTYAKLLAECLIGVSMFVLVAYALFRNDLFFKV
jgi:heparan-alpha-glucosaminide N-acetyltransferase